VICPETHGRPGGTSQAVIQEEDPEKLTYLMHELYRLLNEEKRFRELHRKVVHAAASRVQLSSRPGRPTPKSVDRAILSNVDA
jgi:hypothetical protein